MKTGLMDKANHVTIAEAPIPEIGPGDVLLKTKYAGVCGSDLHAYKGLHPFRKPPVVLGHEISGVIEKVGPGVTDFAVGDEVTVMPVLGCGECELCRQGLVNICYNKTVPGSSGWLGAFVEHFRAPASVTYKLDGLALDAAALAEPLAVAVRAVKRGGVKDGSRVLILGGGTIGILTVAVARAYGAKAVAITDVFDFNLAMARDDFGADAYNALDKDLEKKLLAKYPDKFDVVILCASVEPTVHQSVRLVRRGGTIVVTGMYLEPISFNFIDITLGEIDMAGSQIYTHADFREALRLLKENKYPFMKIITHRMPLDQADAALQLLATHSEPAVKILLEA